jgi:lipoprotein-anchoring transpeptidase ErfK/SrfK
MSESRFTTATQGRRTRRTLAAAATLVLVGVGLSACDAGSPSSSSGTERATSTGATAEAPLPVRLRTKLGRDPQAVPLTKVVSVSATHGSLRKVQVTSKAGQLAGKLTARTNSWAAEGRLEPGTDYVVHAVAERSDGKRVTRTTRFHTEDLTLDQQTYASVAPLQGETVGVGMPVIVTFDLPVTDRASFEKHMRVTSTPRQPGAWHWISDTEVHWRPKAYWKAGTDVHVDVDVNSVPAGHGIYGQESRELDFHVGDAHIYRVNAQTHQMKVFSNGKLLRTLPTTTGKPGFTTRSGVKVIIEKFDVKRMNSETIGIPAGSSEAYDIGDVQWAMRVTYSGEFIHAAPWSVGSQGYANVSHGCTGLSTENAAWLYAMSRRGDVVEYTGTDRPMTLTNGYGDWNESFKQYEQGSALS